VARQPTKRASLADDVYQTLRQEILGLVIAPRVQLDEAAMVHRFAVSRTPVREAIRRLVADKLVELIPHQSARVRPILFEGVRDYFESLRIVQKAVFVLSAARIEPAQIEAAKATQASLEEASACRDIAAIADLNTDFHMAIAIGAGNTNLAEIYQRQMIEGTRLSALTLRRYLVSDWGGEMAKLITDHHDILGAAAAHNQSTMAELSDRHVELSRNQVVKALTQEDPTGLLDDVSDIAAAHLTEDD
jgi:DNA-binding GntR family transcriptional regulator